MATVYTVNESSTRSFVGARIYAFAAPTKIFYNRTYMSYDTSGLSSKSVLLAKHTFYSSTYSVPITVRVRTKDDVIGADLTPGETKFNAFTSGSYIHSTVDITSSATFEKYIKTSEINLTGDTDFQIATPSESGASGTDVLVGLATIRNANTPYHPKLHIYTVEPNTPTVARTPTVKIIPTIANAPYARYNQQIAADVNGEILVDVDITDPPIPESN